MSVCVGCSKPVEPGARTFSEDGASVWHEQCRADWDRLDDGVAYELDDVGRTRDRLLKIRERVQTCRLDNDAPTLRAALLAILDEVLR